MKNSPDEQAVINGDLAYLMDKASLGNLSEVFDEDGNTLLFKAAHYLQKDIIEYLVDVMSFDVNHKNKWGDTPIFYASSVNNSLEVIELFIRLGADLKIKNYQGQTCLDITITKQKEHNFLFLLPLVSDIHKKTMDLVEAPGTPFVFQSLLDKEVERRQLLSSDERGEQVSSIFPRMFF